LAQAIFEPNLFPYKYPKILKPSHSSYLPEDGTDSVPKRRLIKFRRLGITQKKAYNKNVEISDPVCSPKYSVLDLAVTRLLPFLIYKEKQSAHIRGRPKNNRNLNNLTAAL
jgi:hypothetical protein